MWSLIVLASGYSDARCSINVALSAYFCSRRGNLKFAVKVGSESAPQFRRQIKTKIRASEPKIIIHSFSRQLPTACDG